jgi:ribonuclease-3
VFSNIFNFSRNTHNKEFCYSLKDVLGYKPKNLIYYERALTHKSLREVNNYGVVVNNERLEYLGDSVLDTVVADFLFNKFPNEDEGFLTNLRSKIVKRKHLDSLGAKLGLDILIKSKIRGSKIHSHVLGNALEALVGAIYLDRGYKYSKFFIIEVLIKKHVDIEELITTEENFKSRLIEYVQREKVDLVFDTQDTSNKRGKFEAKVILDTKEKGSGIGNSKKEAEQNAAENALKNIEQ